jgi:putative ABC transport system substrate-binding protein
MLVSGLSNVPISAVNVLPSQGENPAELPIERPTVFAFVTNLKAAKAHGVEVQRALVARADRVIE